MTRETVSEAEYQRALELWPTRLLSMVRNASITPHWIGAAGDERFWFLKQTAEGHEFVLVDAASGEQQPAFDHALVGRALGADASALPFSSFEYLDAQTAIAFSVNGRRHRLELGSGALSDLPGQPQGLLLAANGRGLFLRDNNLWLREADGSERALTPSGEDFYAWGMPADLRLTKVAESRGAVSLMPAGTHWAPDSRHLLTQRIDERRVEPYPYLESVPADGSPRPKVHWVRQQLAGEAQGPELHYAIIDADSAALTPIRLPADCGELEISVAYDGGVWWSPDGALLYLLASSASTDHVALLAVDTASGQARIVHQETVATCFHFNTFEYNAPNVAILHERGEAIWYSQHSGWGHLYLLDLERGGIKRALTTGEWAVFDIIRMDGNALYFTAGGREAGRHPYHRYLYRVGLDGDAPNAGLSLLTPEDADHGLPGRPNPAIALIFGAALRQQFSPSGRYFVDCHSRVDRAPKTLIRRADGSHVADLIEADISALRDAGWRPPEPFCAKAADGQTDLYGVLIKPRHFDPGRKWPVLERIYGGPQLLAQPRNFMEGLNGAFTHALNAIAEMGFVVALLDGPGTPYRSKAFHDMTWGCADRLGIVHHRAALEHAAKTRPWMDLGKVGISGHSFGGYAAAMALLLQGEFYQVGVSTAGMYDPLWTHASAERILGRPEFGPDRFSKAQPGEVADNYRQYAPGHYAHRLTGKLLLAYGDLDENAQPAGLLHFIDALIRAGKSYDLLYLPGRNHGFVPEPYFQKRMWDYFIEHVQGRVPLHHYSLDVQAGLRAVI